MENRQFEKRTEMAGSIICENGCVRLRVVRHGISLGVMLEAEDAEGNDVSLLHIPDEHLAPMAVTAGGAAHFRYVSFDPIEIHGETRGVRLSGYLDDDEVALTALLSTSGTWGHFLFEAPTLPARLTRFAHRWLATEQAISPEVFWPREMVSQHALTGNPAAFFQMGPIFSALVVDLEEGDPRQLGLSTLLAGAPGFDYGICLPAEHSADPAPSMRFAYALCLDTHAVPDYGYQQLLRYLGNPESLPPLAAGKFAAPTSGLLPALPAVPEVRTWLPFVREGSPAEIAALVAQQLRGAGRSDWSLLEGALQWLDRLCLHQRLSEVSGGGRFGGFGEGPDWRIVVQWMPHLLLEAFRLTGNPEYAYRGMAAINALAPKQQGVVLGNLHPRFGDIFINADQGAAVFFTHLSHFHSRMTPNGIILEVANARRPQPLQLVMEGTHDCYQVEVNGKALGFLPTAQLRRGILLPA